jgi:hypothetical protein
MPRVLLPIRESIVRSVVGSNPGNTSPQERPQRKIFWNDDFDNLIDLPPEIERLAYSETQICRHQIDATSFTESGNPIGGPRQAIGQRDAAPIDGCFGSRVGDGSENVFMVACLLLLANGAAMAIYLRLRRWRPGRDIQQERIVAASIIVGPDSKAEV